MRADERAPSCHARRALALLQRLEDRLEAVSELVSALGMLEVHTVVMDDLSPLYFPERAGALPVALTRALAALERG